jgi:ABC-type multidrug transport system ATPase subunit
MLGKLKQQHISILVSTPYMDEAKLCDRIALMQGGKIMSVDKPGNLMQSFPKALFAVKAQNIYKLLQDLRSDEAVESCFAFGEYLHMTLKNDSDDEKQVKTLAAKYHHESLEVKKITPAIEDSFIRLMREQHMDTAIKPVKETSDGR